MLEHLSAKNIPQAKTNRVFCIVPTWNMLETGYDEKIKEEIYAAK